MRAATPSERYDALEFLSVLADVLTELPAREERVVRLRFGLGVEPTLQHEIARQMDISTARAGQLERKALIRLAGRRRAKRLLPYLGDFGIKEALPPSPARPPPAPAHIWLRPAAPKVEKPVRPPRVDYVEAVYQILKREARPVTPEEMAIELDISERHVDECCNILENARLIRFAIGGR